MEIEFKYLLEDSAQGEFIIADLQEKYPEIFGSKRDIKMVSTYYDSVSGSLLNARYTLRLRMENEESICCVKYDSVKRTDGLSKRVELECAAADISDGVKELSKRLPQEFLTYCSEGLKISAVMSFTRTAVELMLKDMKCELAFDRGFFGGGENAQPFFELEIEYKSGNTESFIALAKTIGTLYSLKPENRSKLARARLLNN